MRHKDWLLAVAIFLLSLPAFAQMKRPNIMVVPSDAWCIQNGYYTEFEDFGTIRKIPDYRTALQQNSEMRSLIMDLGHMMEGYDYPLRDLEQMLKKVEQDEAEQALTMSRSTGDMIAESPLDRLHRIAKCDIIIDVDYRTVKNGPFSSATLNIKAVDPYNAQTVASCPPAVTESVAANVETLLHSNVLNIETMLCPGIMKHFEDTYEHGRQARILLKRFEGCPYDFESGVSFQGDVAELGEVIVQWFAKNCIGGRFNIDDATEDTMDFNPARIPVRDVKFGLEQAVEANDFARKLQGYLSDEYGIESKVTRKGLGEAWVILGEK